MKPRPLDHSGELLRSLTRLCFHLHLLGRLSLLVLPFILGICLPSLRTPLFPLPAPALTLFYRQDAAFAHLDSLPSYDLVLWTDGSVLLPFGKGGSGLLANCFLCGTEAFFPSFFLPLPQSLWPIWQELSSLSSCSIRLQCVP